MYNVGYYSSFCACVVFVCNMKKQNQKRFRSVNLQSVVLSWEIYAMHLFLHLL